MSAFADQVKAEARRRYGLPGLPDALDREIRRAEVAGQTAAQLVAHWGERFNLEDVPPHQEKPR